MRYEPRTLTTLCLVTYLSAISGFKIILDAVKDNELLFFFFFCNYSHDDYVTCRLITHALNNHSI